MVELSWFTLWYYWIPKFLSGIFIIVVIPIIGILFFVVWDLLGGNKGRDERG